MLDSPESAGNTFSLLKPLLRVNAQTLQITLSFHRWTGKSQRWKRKRLELGNSCLGRDGVTHCRRVDGVRWGGAYNQVCVLKEKEN